MGWSTAPRAICFVEIIMGFIRFIAVRIDPCTSLAGASPKPSQAAYCRMPFRNGSFEAATTTMLTGRQSGLSINRSDADPDESNAAYRWLAEPLMGRKHAMSLSAPNVGCGNLAETCQGIA